MSENFFAGIDIGASATKAVIIDDKAGVAGSSVRKTGIDFKSAASECFEKALAGAGIGREAVEGMVSTGYGRTNTDLSDWVRTEISCLSKGAYHYFPQALCVVDIGGQDNKMIRLDAGGRIADFQMNRKCAAGTGAFLEEIANRLELQLDELEPLARKGTQRVELGAFCTVFTFTEILTHLRQGAKVEELAWGALLSIAKRINESGLQRGTVVLTGGVIEHNPLIAELLKEEFELDVLIPQNPQFVCAFGAALMSRERHSES